MPHIEGTETLPHPVDKVFDTAMGLEKYPNILPYIKAVRVISDTNGSMKVVLVLGLSMLRFHHTCDIIYEKNAFIAVSSTNRLFKAFSSRCDFLSEPDNKTCLNYSLNCQFANPVIEFLAGNIVTQQTQATINAFKRYLEKT